MRLCSNKEVANFTSFPTMYNSTDFSHMAHEEQDKQILGDLSAAVLWCKTVKKR